MAGAFAAQSFTVVPWDKTSATQQGEIKHTGNHNKRPCTASRARQPEHLSVSWPENVDVTTKLQFQFTCLFDAPLSHMTTH